MNCSQVGAGCKQLIEKITCLCAIHARVLEIPAEFHNVSPELLAAIGSERTVLLVEKQRAVAGTKLNLPLIAEQSSGVDAAEQIVECRGRARLWM